MDSHTILHNSEKLLSSVYKLYGEDRINLSISLKNEEIPSCLDEIFIKSENDFVQNIA